MSDLISRQAAQTELMMQCERYTLSREESNGIVGHVEWSSDLISVVDAMDAIRDLPSAQPERKAGKWIQTDELWTDMYTAEEQNIYECDSCGEKVIGKPGWRFCPNCGCQMLEGEDDG